ncbi:HEPN/Toprim-associated domain-containing protein [Clavibacter nebraskensis]|uniref:HEPN/Toprim N-terminal domain-containing protein n=2 Tax=Clavibacter nebraskensis TaxID=31963 RepID=A0AAI9EL60_9MICO|nr:HEPN/Toprim-associated domain-containing protein [Clavibacter nebraskensis]QKO03375.1 hypothetical protein EGX35_14810 [Clavibacter nebraskensis]QLL36499.1 hypothetical protein EGX36_14860 [Clavibacter nebraskensis]QLL36602.1 hypothetical protein EGX37_14810 [Clavibacter nebraskensis]UQB04485.1 hypothetical protein LIV34_002324 [Clavibacter nebraskensis]UQB07309.1 hypothetical protein LIX21_002325 [Clavibacter nebraskensis]
MCTEITLSLNGIDIDWGKNRFWKNHYWLFPPTSLTDIPYLYADNEVEWHPGFETSLDQARFRLCQLGYSLEEAKSKFQTTVSHWSRRSYFELSFDAFREALSEFNFHDRPEVEPGLGPSSFKSELAEALAACSPDDGCQMEDFVYELDFSIILRTLAEQESNRPLPLRWHYYDLVENGWATIDDLLELDRNTAIMNHSFLMGRLQDYTQLNTVSAFDRWLAGQGIPQETPYWRSDTGDKRRLEKLTLPTAVRNMIHHPENLSNRLLDEDIRKSVELLLEITGRPPYPLKQLTQ